MQRNFLLFDRVNMEKKIHKQNGGFTLVELILYIALVTIFISGAVRFGWDIIFAGAKSNVQMEVNHNLRLASKRIALEIKQASAINSLTATSLCLASPVTARNPTRIYVSAGRLRMAWGGGSATCASMTNDQPLTSNQVTVSGLTFTNRTSGTVSQNVLYSFTVSSTGARREWQKTQTYSGAAELRSR